MTSATDRFVQAYEECGYTQESLAKALGYASSGAIGNAVGRGSLPKKMAEFEALTRIRAIWVKEGTGPKYVSQQDHQVILPDSTVPHIGPPKLELEELKMKKIAELPTVFRVQAPDGSMSPRWPRGQWIVFERAKGESLEHARDGWPMLVRVNDESVHMRRMKHVEAGWVAAPEDADFAAYKSWEVDLKVVATMLHAEVPPDAS